MEREVRERHLAEIDRILRDAEALDQPPVASLFDDVYEELPWHLVEQREHLLDETTTTRVVDDPSSRQPMQ